MIQRFKIGDHVTYVEFSRVGIVLEITDDYSVRVEWRDNDGWIGIGDYPEELLRLITQKFKIGDHVKYKCTGQQGKIITKLTNVFFEIEWDNTCGISWLWSSDLSLVESDGAPKTKIFENF